MKRIYKFRAWDSKRMYHVQKMLMGAHGGDCFQVDGINFDNMAHPEIKTMNICEEDCGQETPHCVLMQFTGLLDKNGKEIYEGDIVKGREGTVKGAVEFGQYTKGRFHKHDSQTEHIGWYVQSKKGKLSLEDLEWYIKPNYSPFRGQYLEIIGNIYENPDLLTPTGSKR